MERTRDQRKSLESTCFQKDSDIGRMMADIPAGRISCFQNIIRQFSFTVVSGTDILDADMRQHLPQIVSSGRENSNRMLPETGRYRNSYRQMAGMWWLSGNAKLPGRLTVNNDCNDSNTESREMDTRYQAQMSVRPDGNISKEVPEYGTKFALPREGVTE